jgi:hypothetical protein
MVMNNDPKTRSLRREYAVPPKVDAAQHYVDWVYNHRLYVHPDAQASHPIKELDEREKRTYESALDVLYNYFRGETEHLPPLVTVEGNKKPARAR